MAFPPYVHAVIPDDNAARWPIQRQGINECGCTAPAIALNLLLGRQEFHKDAFVSEAGALFQRSIGGSPSFVTATLIKRHGFGTHFGMLRGPDREIVLRDLIDRGVPVCIELGANKLGPLTVFGQHTVVLVGYSDPYTDARGQRHEEYFFVDAQYPPEGGVFGLHTNDLDRDGDGILEHYPGNRTMTRSEFLPNFPTGIYFPVFGTQTEHDAWYDAHIRPGRRSSSFRGIAERWLTGTHDEWQG